MKRNGKRISASLLAMIMVISMVVPMVVPMITVPVAALPVPSGTNGIYWLDPDDSSAPYCQNATVDVWINSSIPFFGGTFRIETDPDTCGEFVVGSDGKPIINANNTVFNYGHVVLPGSDKHVLRVRYQTVGSIEVAPGAYHIGNFSIHCNSTAACVTDLEFISDVPNTYITNGTGDKDTVEDNGTFTCEAEEAAIDVDIRADGIDGNIFDVTSYTVNPGTVTDTDASHTINNQTAMGAMMVYCRDNGINVDISTGTWGNWTIQIGSNASDMYSWMYAVDGATPWVAGDKYGLSGGEYVHWFNYLLTYNLTVTSAGCCPVNVTYGWGLTDTVPAGQTKTYGAGYYYDAALEALDSSSCGFKKWVYDGTEDPVNKSITVHMDGDKTATAYCTGGIYITVNATVGTASPEVICKCEGPDDDPAKEGTQVEPNLWPDTKTVMKCAIVCDENGKDDIKYVNATTYYPNGTVKETQTMHVASESERAACCCGTAELPNETCQVYAGYITMEACDPAGDYMLNVTAKDTDGLTDSLENTFEYLSIIGLDFDLNAVGFGTIAPGETKVVPGDDAWGAPNLTVHSIGNGPINIEVSATDMTSGGNVITKDNIDCEIDALGSQWLDAPKTFDLDLECCSYENVDLSLHVPEGTAQGAYTGTVTFIAKHA